MLNYKFLSLALVLTSAAQASSTVGMDFFVKNSSGYPVEVSVTSEKSNPESESSTFNPNDNKFVLNDTEKKRFEHEEFYYFESSPYQKDIKLTITRKLPGKDVVQVCHYKPSINVRINTYLSINTGENEGDKKACSVTTGKGDNWQFLELNILKHVAPMAEIIPICKPNLEMGEGQPIKSGESLCSKGTAKIKLKTGGSKSQRAEVIQITVQKSAGVSSDSAHFKVTPSEDFLHFPSYTNYCSYTSGTCTITLASSNNADGRTIEWGAIGQLTITNTGGEDFQIGNVDVSR